VKHRQVGFTRVGTVIGAASTSGGFTALSFFTETLPVLQWVSVFVGIIAGVLAIVLAVKKLKRYGRAN
jgi:hypothetical protein